MRNEKLYTQFGSIRSSFLATPISNFLTLGGCLARTECDIFMRYVSKNQKFNNLSKTVSFVKIFIFSTKMRYSSLDSLDRGTKVGFKMKYNCYTLPIQALKKFIESWWGDIRVRIWNFKKSQKIQLIEETL
jgi:hypothetical protein